MTQNSSFSCFVAVFMSYCPFLGVLGRFTTTVRPDTYWRDVTKTRRFCIYGYFNKLLPTILGFQKDYNTRKSRYMLERCDQNLVVFAFYGRFHEPLLTVLWFQGDLHQP